MRARVAALSPRTLVLVGAALVLVYTASAWFLVVSPKRAESAALRDEVAATEVRLVEAQSAANRPSGAGVPVVEVLRLAKAMPASGDQTGLLLELSSLASESRVTLRSIAPQPPVVAEGGPTYLPVAVTVGGNYLQISRFLARAHRLVSYRRGKVRSTGRLLAVQSIELVESAGTGFPGLDATITLNAYVYDGPIVPLAQPEGADDEAEPAASAAAGSTS
ncbi:MAG TPA: type 4a pilus biogenesis protein PilO [Gaiellaceae bacterium]|nr:type 4a pilus biogenesis protein PilO [Gaiellaceae bacterium]